MKLSPTLNIYLAKHFLVNCLVITAIILGIVYLVETIETLRRATKFEGVSLPVVLQISLFKLPEVGQIIIPFCVLFGTVLSFWQLGRRSEIVILKGSGLSTWQFLMPYLFTGLIIGIAHTTILNPLGAVLLSKYEQMENLYLEHESSLVSLFEDGIWLRQSYQDGYVILHAGEADVQTWEIKDITLYFFDRQNGFKKRIDAPHGRLKDRLWLFHDVVIATSAEISKRQEDFRLNTTLLLKDIEESVLSPESISFWELPGLITNLENAGFDSTSLHIKFHSLLSKPLLILSMIVLGAAVSLKLPRSGNTMILIFTVLGTGFVIFFADNVLKAMGEANQMPVILAAWSSALISLAIGVSIILNIEE